MDARQQLGQLLSTMGYDEAQLALDSTGTLVTLQPPAPRWDVRLPTLQTERSGERAADLEMRTVLGEGGMGRVLAAEQVALRREVAVKVVRPGAPGTANGHLLREALVAGRLEHPNIVPVYLLGTTPEGEPLFVMRKIEGVPWSEVLQDAGRAPAFFARATKDPLAFHLSIFTRVCEATHFAHARGVLHRDLKPDNVMLGGFGEVYLVDWGLAVSLTDDGVLQPARSVNTLAGTPRYMAPEMAACDAAAFGPRTDVFLLGAVLYELVAGAAPFMGQTPMEQLVRAYDCAYRPLPADTPPELVAIVQKALARDPAARFDSVDELRRATLDFLEHRASWSLSQAADGRAVELSALVAREDASDDDAARAQELFTECRYGYRQALEAWPDNAEARRGLQRVIELMIEHELHRKNAQGALSLLPQLPTPRPELTERVERARTRAARAVERLSQLEAFRRDVDMQVGLDLRGYPFLFTGIFWLVASLAAYWLDATGRWPFGYREAFAAIGLHVLMTLGGIAWIQHRQRSNSAQRRLLLGGALLGVALFAHWISSYFLALSLTQALVLFLCWVSGSWLLAAALVDWRALVTAGALALGALAVALWPAWQILAFGIAVCAGFTALGSLWIRDARALAAEPRASMLP